MDTTELINTGNEVAAEIQETASTIATLPPDDQIKLLKNFLQTMLPKCVTAVVLFIVGMFLIRLVMKFTRKMLTRSTLDPTLHSFILSILRAVLLIFLGIVVLTVLVPSAVGSMVALLGVFGLAVSLAVKDSLANLASGISVLFTKPFSLGDYVSIGDYEGTIQEIRLNYTVLKTVDNKLIHTPNGDVAKAHITNFTGEPVRRLDLEFSIGYEDDFEKAKAIILEIITQHPSALPDPAPLVRMTRHGDSAIVLISRTWCKTEDYWNMRFDFLEEVKRRFDQEGITIPYNQMNVYVKQI